jgi:PAS domain S-box-containing protein
MITFVNDNFCKISGYSREEILGKNHRMIKSDYHDKNFYNEMWKTISSGKLWKGKIKNKAKNGTEYWVFSSIIPLCNNVTGKVEQYFSIRFDMTHEKKLESELEAEQSKSIHMSRLAALGEMAGSVAHEINNPVAVILGKAHILKRTVEKVEDPAVQESILSKIKSIEEHSRRITKIVKGLREFSHGGENESEEKIHSTQLIESVLELCGEKLKTNAVVLKTNCPDLTFSSPKLQIEQVLVNLINNSVDAISGKDEKWIEVEIEESVNAVHFSVTDSGDGISKEIINKMMQPFFTTKPVGVGTGLGLSISKGLIERLGGDFYYDSHCSHTCFKISLPKDEFSIFTSLNYSFVAECMNKAKLKLDYRLKMDELQKSSAEFSLRIPECPFYEWLVRFESRLGKNLDYIELKKGFESVQAVMNDIEWKYVNNNLVEELDIERAHKMLEINIDLVISKLEEMTKKYTFNESLTRAS